MARLVLSDASPLIGLSRVAGLAWLRALFGRIVIPREVQAEVLPRRGLPGEDEIATALAEGWLVGLDATPVDPSLPDLDEGEAACIRLALANPGPSLLLMDERAGRATAVALGLKVAGTAAVIGMAKRRGLIPSARAVFADLHAAEFRIAPAVIETVLRQVGE